MDYLMVFGIICEKKTKVSLLYATHTISINGFTSHVNIEAEYINENQHKTEAKFVFPVEEDSAVYKFEAKIGDVHLVAKSKDKDVAKKEYKEAVDKGQSAILLRETSTSGDIFEYSLVCLSAKHGENNKELSFISVPERLPCIFSEEKLILYLVLHETETSCENVKLNLCGKIGESDFSLDFEASLFRQIDQEMTIHRLCVRRKIQELELKEDLGKGDEIKSEIIDLGTVANLVSKYTSFVGLKKNIPEFKPMSPRAFSLAPASPQYLGDYECISFDHVDSSTDFVDSGFDSVDSRCLSWTFRRSLNVSDVESFMFSETTNKDILTCLVDLQAFYGFWNLDNQLAQALNISLKDLNNENPSVSDKIWATALVVAVLREKLASQHCEWELMEKKAMVWLESQNIQPINSEKLLEKATNFIRNKMVA
uniref:VIT domain-containing protein n=1 Tax=Octopus bimaculoides TaxID=37653 RepID=A0A0L8GA14_OCTBM